MPDRYRALSVVAALLLALLVVACGGTTTSGTTIVPAATSAPATGGATAQSAPDATAPVVADTTAAPVEPTAATAQIANVGDRIEQGGVAFTVTKAERNDKPSQFAVAKEGNTFIVAEVLIENVSSADKIMYNPFFAKLKDADGFEYQIAFGADQALSNGELAKGEKARGNLLFEVKKTAKGLVLSYQPNPFDSNSLLHVSIPDA